MIKKLASPALEGWLDGLIRETNVVGVQARQGGFAFEPLTSAADLRLDYDVTVLPPKAFFLPPREALLKFDKQSGYASVDESEPFVLVGVHPYDVVAIQQMDVIFAEGQRDEHYLKRRAQATIVACDVQTPSSDVFAGHVGTATVTEGYDSLLTAVEGGYVVDAATEKGLALMASLGDVPDATEQDLAMREDVWESNRAQLRKHELRAGPERWSELLDAGADHPVWEEKARLCFSCGSCNLVCPTCYCFDVKEELDWGLTSGRRVRCWDGCLLKDFATVAGDHNFRKDRAARFRHRYYRKGRYVPEKIGGQVACVGCGRCITACVANIADPVEVFNRLSEES